MRSLKMHLVLRLEKCGGVCAISALLVPAPSPPLRAHSCVLLTPAGMQDAMRSVVAFLYSVTNFTYLYIERLAL